jgi:hypothetical protein
VGATIGADQLDLLGRGAEQFMAARERHDPEHFYDVAFDDLARDAVGTVEAIYRHFDLPWSEDVRAVVAAEDVAGRSGPRAPAHRYSLGDFGITDADVDKRFADYTARYL